MTRNRKWADVKKKLEQIRTNVTGSNWREPYERHEELTVAQQCRADQELNDPRQVYFCGRCGHATGSYQGHYWRWCRKDPDSVKGLMAGKPTVDFHVCCPGSCSLTDPDPDPVQRCHPHPDQREQWVRDKVAERENFEKWQAVLKERGHL